MLYIHKHTQASIYVFIYTHTASQTQIFGFQSGNSNSRRLESIQRQAWHGNANITDRESQKRQLWSVYLSPKPYEDRRSQTLTYSEKRWNTQRFTVKESRKSTDMRFSANEFIMFPMWYHMKYKININEAIYDRSLLIKTKYGNLLVLGHIL